MYYHQMDPAHIRDIKVLSRKYIIEQELSYLYELFLIFYKRIYPKKEIISHPQDMLIHFKKDYTNLNEKESFSPKKRRLKDSETNKKCSKTSVSGVVMFDFSKSSLQQLNQIKYCSLEIIKEIEDYLENDNYEDKKICETCIYILKEGLKQINQRNQIESEQRIKDQLRDSNNDLDYLQPPGEDDISSFFG